MLNPADVAKIRYHFVHEVAKYFQRKKYVVETYFDKTYFLNYALATTFEDAGCLTHELECMLTLWASDLPSAPTNDPVTVPCADQLIIDLVTSQTVCDDVTASNIVYTPNYIQLTLGSNSYYHDPSVANLSYVNCSGNSVNLITPLVPGYQRTGSLTRSSFSDDLRLRFITTFTLNNNPSTPLTDPTGYLSSIRLYNTDQYGNGSTLYDDYNIAPSNLAAWTSCGTCSAVNAADLVFGASNANYQTALTTLLENISKTLYGGVYIKPIVVASFPNLIYISTVVKHSPTSRSMAINHFDARVSFVPATAASPILKTFTPNAEALLGSSDFYYAAPFTINRSCNGSTLSKDYMVYGNFSNWPYVSAGSTWRNIVLTNNQLPATFSVDEEVADLSCTTDQITANVTPSGTYTYSWENPSSVEISTTATATLTTAGTYTLTLDSENGCTFTETYEYGG